MLISVNPFKQMPYFGDKEIEMYQGAVSTFQQLHHITCKQTRFGIADVFLRFKVLTVWKEKADVVQAFQLAVADVTVRNLTQPLSRLGSTFTKQPVQVCLLYWPACREWAGLFKPGTDWKAFKTLTDCENSPSHSCQFEQLTFSDCAQIRCIFICTK